MCSVLPWSEKSRTKLIAQSAAVAGEPISLGLEWQVSKKLAKKVSSR